MKPMDHSAQTDLDARYRTMLILWFALFMNIAIFFVFSLLMSQERSNNRDTAPSILLPVVFTALGTLLVALSFAVKGKLLKRSVETQDVQLVQKALVIACAMCEASALLGLIERFLGNGREYYLLFLIAALGTALHFPRREHLVAATYKTSRGAASS
ncbi:MAG: hypothetical protein ACR2G5_03100 [Pyrinomonadaceae bacterium]